MKRIAFLALVVVLLGGLALVKHARASDTAPPSKMDASTAIRLDRDLAHLREAAAIIERLQRETRPFNEDAKAILATAKIDEEAFNRGEVRVDFATGEITRPKVASK